MSNSEVGCLPGWDPVSRALYRAEAVLKAPAAMYNDFSNIMIDELSFGIKRITKQESSALRVQKMGDEI
jgi:hypothetical protein